MLMKYYVFSNVENSCAASYFCENHDVFQDNLKKKVKQQHLLKTEILCKIINLVTATFDQFNAFLMNTSNDIFQKS